MSNKKQYGTVYKYAIEDKQSIVFEDLSQYLRKGV